MKLWTLEDCRTLLARSKGKSWEDDTERLVKTFGLLVESLHDAVRRCECRKNKSCCCYAKAAERLLREVRDISKA